MAVLVTGGAGFVGAYVVRDLLARGERVVAFDSSIRDNVIDLVLAAERGTEGVTLVQADITDGWALLRACQSHGVDRIVHLASPLTEHVAANPSRGIADVCMGTATVFEVASALQLRRVVWASSVAVFGPAAAYPSGPIANDAAHRPQSLYGSCKSLCETLAATYREAHGLASIGLRLTMVYGAGRLRGFMSLPSDLIRRVALGMPAMVPLPECTVNWQYVEDVAALVVGCLDAPEHVDGTFNTNGDPRKFHEAAGILEALVPGAEIAFSADPLGAAQEILESAPSAYDDAPLRERLGYHTVWSLEDGIEASVRHVRTHGRGTASSSVGGPARC